MDDELYNNYKVSDILKDNNIKNKDEIVQTAFESQKGNELLIITFFAQKKVDEKELLRRKTAGQVDGLKAKISVLKKDLARANQKINWLSNNQKAPTKEEILAYELQMKEVEKKLKWILKLILSN